jgi:hypothetical protein
MKKQILKRIKKSQKLKTIIQTMGLITLLSTYFLVSYFMALRTYDSIPETLAGLNIIYFKDACVENVIAFARENVMRNTTILLSEDNKTDAAEYQLNDCYEREREYRDLRKNLPPALDDVKDFMEQIEGPNICNMLFSNDSSKVEWCEEAYFGVVKKGLSNYYQIILNDLQSMNLKFRSSPRTLQNLKDYTWDNETLLLIGIKNFILDNALSMFKDRST